MAKLHVNALIFLLLPDELINYLLWIMPLDEISKQYTISKYHNETIRRAIDTHPNFWHEKAKMSLSEEQLKEPCDYKKLVFERHYLRRIMKNEITKGINAYIRKKRNPLTFLTNDDLYEFKNDMKSISFSLDTVASYLIEDNPEKLFAIFAPFNKLAAAFSHENLSKIELTMIIRYSIDALNIFTSNEIRLIDLYFIGFIPFIMKARAIHCFDLFIRAYLNLAVGVDHNLLEHKNLKMTPTYLFELVFSSNDPYFNKKLISLAFKIIPGNDAILLNLLQFYHEKNAMKFVTDSLSSLTAEKTKDIQEYLEIHEKEHLQKALFPTVEACFVI